MGRLFSLIYLISFLHSDKIFAAIDVEDELKNSFFTNINYENEDNDDNYEKYKRMQTPEIISSFGYEVETHFTTTEDGYILQLHRIPRGIRTSIDKNTPRPVVLLQHGLLSSSSDWVMDKPDRALAYLLADAGYDVWMNNFRGNTYSRNHTELNPDKKKLKFWSFSWDEMALKDLPTAFDYILNSTEQVQLYYVGYSLSTTTLFALVSEKPEYANKIKVAALMGPVAYLEHLKGPLRLLVPYAKKILKALFLTRQFEFLKSGRYTHWLAELCGKSKFETELCLNMLSLIAGYDEDEFNKDLLPIILWHTPAGTSIKAVNHYIQLYESGIFRMYDYGKVGNLKVYKQFSPPRYNLEENIYPIGLFWGENDWIATPKDVKKLISKLPNVVLSHKIDEPKWNHFDFIWAVHAKENLYDQIIDFLKRY